MLLPKSATGLCLKYTKVSAHFVFHQVNIYLVFLILELDCIFSAGFYWFLNNHLSTVSSFSLVFIGCKFCLIEPFPSQGEN